MIANDRTGGTSHGSGNPPVTISGDFACFIKAVRELGVKTSDEGDSLHLFASIELRKVKSYASFVRSAAGGSEAAAADVIALAELDRDLRAEVMWAIGIVESQVKARYGALMTSECGERSVFDASFFMRQDRHRDALNAIKRELRISSRRNTSDWTQPDPDERASCRAAIDAATLGSVSKLYANTASKAVRSGVAASFGIDSHTFASWLRTVNAVRNICAHCDVLVARRQIPATPLGAIGRDDDNAKPLFILAMLRELLAGRDEFLGLERSDAARFTARASAILRAFERERPELARAICVPEGFATPSPADASPQMQGACRVLYRAVSLVA